MLKPFLSCLFSYSKRQGWNLTHEQVSDQAFLCWPQLSFLLEDLSHSSRAPGPYLQPLLHTLTWHTGCSSLPAQAPAGANQHLTHQKAFLVLLYLFPLSKRSIKKFYNLPFLICKASPLPSWVKHSSPALPPTNTILPVTIQAKTATAPEFLLFILSGLPSSKEALRCNSCRDAKGKKASTPLGCSLTLSCRVGMLNSIFCIFLLQRSQRKTITLPFPPDHPVTPSQLDLVELSVFQLVQISLRGSCWSMTDRVGLALQEEPASLQGPSSTRPSTACVAAETNNKYFV